MRPNQKSTHGLSLEDKKHIKLISWKEITEEWIKEIIKHEKIKEKTALVECLKQYYSAIESFIKNEREKKSMMGLILKDKETLKAATEISNTYLNIAKTEALRALFENIKEKLNTKNNSEFKLLEVDNGTEDVDDFYRRGKTYPNVTYLFKNSLVQPIIGDDFEVAVRLEIDSNIFVGICFPYRNYGKYINNKLPNGWKENKPAGFILEEIKNYKDKYEKNNPDDNNWWYGWKYIKIDNETINFKKADSDIYYDIIFNESKRNDFLEECNNVFNYFCTLVKNAFKKVDHSE